MLLVESFLIILLKENGYKKMKLVDLLNKFYQELNISIRFISAIEI
jgi:DNA-directed RNA polymerase delta subunit